MHTSAELRIEDTTIDKNDNPGKVALIKYLTRLSPENINQAESCFFYLDEGTGGQSLGVAATSNSIIPYKLVTTLAGADLAADTNTHILSIVESPTYNPASVKRVNRSVSLSGNTQKFVDLIIPLAVLFDFYDAHDFPFRGLKHEIILQRELTLFAKYYQMGVKLSDNATTGNAQKFKINRASLWVPRLKPSLSQMAVLNSLFAQKVTTPLAWKSYMHKSKNFVSGDTQIDWVIANATSRPTAVYIFYQSAARYNMTTAQLNNQVFEAPPLETCKLSFNNHIYPNYEIKTNFTNQDYYRLYLMYLEISNKFLHQVKTKEY